MTNLTRIEITDAIVEMTAFRRKEVSATVNLTFAIITQALGQARNVELRNFGVFEVQKREARIGRNPKRPEQEVLIPRRAVVKFKNGKALKQLLKEIDPASL